MSTDLQSIGMDYPSWQAAVDVAISSNRLSVIGELDSGQLVQFRDPSGAQIIILAAQPYAVFAGFFPSGDLKALVAHVHMIDRITARLDILDANGNIVDHLEAHLAQGPLLQEEKYQQVYVTLLAHEDPHGPYTVTVDSARYVTNQTTGQRYRVVEISDPDLYTVCLPDGDTLPQQGEKLILNGTLSAVILPPPSCGGSDGGCGNGCCGCG